MGIPSFEDIIREEQERYEQKGRDRVNSSPLKKNKKRKADRKSAVKSDTANFCKSVQVLSTTRSDTHVKRQKQKLETHREPITPDTHSNKRTSAPNTPPPSKSPKKSTKYRIPTVHQPITSDAHGSKRPSPPMYVFCGSKKPYYSATPMEPLNRFRKCRSFNYRRITPISQEKILHYADGIQIDGANGSTKRRRTSSQFSRSSNDDVFFATPSSV